MNRLLLICSCLLSFNAMTQNDTLISNVEARWKFNAGTFEGDVWSGWQTYDSLINDSVFMDGKYWSSYYLEATSSVAAYINIDSGKIYVKFNNYDLLNDTVTTFLLYDFEIGIGDTGYFHADSGTPAVVFEIGDTLFSGQTLKYYKFNNTDLWIEKVGSIHGLLHPRYDVVYLGGDRVLCDYTGQYKDSLGNSYIINVHDEAGCMVNVEPENKTRFNVVVSEDFIVIKEDNFQVQGQMARIYELSGKLVCQAEITQSSQYINWSGFSSGLYIVQLGNYSQKIVKP